MVVRGLDTPHRTATNTTREEHYEPLLACGGLPGRSVHHRQFGGLNVLQPKTAYKVEMLHLFRLSLCT